MKVLNLMKKINLLLILVLFSALCTGCSEHIVIKYNDYNELLTGTITGNNPKDALIKLKFNSSGIICSGKSKITNKTKANYILPTYHGLEGNVILKCDDGKSKYLEWKILNLGLSNFRGTGEDAYKNKLSFYFDENEKKVNDKFEQFKKDVAAKPLLKDFKPAAFYDPPQLKSKETKLTGEPDFKPYIRAVERSIKTNWDPPKGNPSNIVVVLFKIGKDGRLLSKHIYKPSGFANYDKAALKAVKLSAPFKPLPKEFKENSVDIMFTFDYVNLDKLGSKIEHQNSQNLAPIPVSRTEKQNWEPYVSDQNKIKKLTRLSPTPTLMAVNPTLNNAKPTSSIEPPKLNLKNPKPIGLDPVPISKTGQSDFIHYMEEQNQKLAQLTHTSIKMSGVSDFKPYLANLERRIKMNWNPPKGNENKRAEVLFKIGRDGRLLSKSIYKSSGFPNYDKAALNAIELAEPFRPLPKEYKYSSVDIVFTFDYNLVGTPPLYK